MLRILNKYSGELVGGALVTFQLALVVWLLGLLIGLVLGSLRSSLKKGAAEETSSILAMVVSAVPILVFLLWFHYPFQAWLGIVVPPFYTAAAVLSAYNGLVVSDLVRGAIRDFPPSFKAAAAISGVPRWSYVWHVMLPIVMRSVLPGYIVSQVNALHLTLFASLISVSEIFRVAQRVNAIEYQAVAVFSILALFYFVLSFPLLLLSRVVQARLVLPGMDR